MTTGNNRESISCQCKVQKVEVCVFLLLIVPSMLLSFFIVRQGGMGFTVAACSTIARDLALASLILFFLWRNGEPFGQIGLSFDHLWSEVAWGAGLFIPLTIGAGLMERLLLSAGFTVPATPMPSFLAARGVEQFSLAFILVTVVAVSEEVIFRGYLLLRFQALTHRPVAALLLSATTFALGHGYEGSAGVVTVGMMGLAFAVIYVWRRSIIAPITMHFLQDFLAIVLLPALATK